MQIDRYMSRIGYTGDLTPNLENLTKILRCHLETVPFENLSFYKNPRQMPLDTESLFDKVVNRRMGGVCFELNGLFCTLLEELGYDCIPVSVRILLAGGPGAITHQGNVARINGREYYCDVGFGGPGPKGIIDMDETEVQIIDGEPFRVEREDPYVTIFRMHEGQFVPILKFVNLPSDRGDFPILLYFFTAHPQSHFVTSRIVNLCRPDGSLALTDKQFTIRRNGEVIRRDLETEEEVAQVLATEFGLVL